jgi:rubredoxin
MNAGMRNMKCEVCDDTFETIQRIEEEVAPADDGTPFERVVEWKRCPTCGSGMKIWHTAFPKEIHGEE